MASAFTPTLAVAEAIEDADVAIVEKVTPSDKLASRALAFIGEIGDQPPMRGICGAVIAFGLFRGDERLAIAGLRMLAAHTIATAAKNAVKNRIDRVRPDARESEDDHRIKPGTSKRHDDTSFPSGHSAGALAVGAAFARAFPEHKVSALGTAGAIALAQVPRRSHYLSDVIVGSAIGLVSEAALSRFISGLRSLRRR